MNGSSAPDEDLAVIFINRENLSIRHADRKILGSGYSKKIQLHTDVPVISAC
jgi:hypothetical protein